MAGGFRIQLWRKEKGSEFGKPLANYPDAIKQMLQVIRLCLQRNEGATVGLEQFDKNNGWHTLRQVSVAQIGRAHFPDGQFDKHKFHYDSNSAR